MSTPEPNPPSATTPPVSTPPPTPPRNGLAWVLAIVAGLIAGGVGWGVGEVFQDRFPPDLSVMSTPKAMKMSRGEQAALDQYLRQVSYKDKAVAVFGVLGAALGLGLGLAGGLAARSLPRAAIAGVIGLTLAGVAGAGASFGIIPMYYKMVMAHSGSDVPDQQPSQVGEDDPMANKAAGKIEPLDLQAAEADGNVENMLYPLMMHGTIFGAIGLAAGLAFAFGFAGVRRLVPGLIGGLMGGILAAVVFEFASSSLYALESPPRPVSDLNDPRIIAHAVGGLLIALGAAFGTISLQLSATRPAKSTLDPVSKSAPAN